jgi:hypothetical protein
VRNTLGKNLQLLAPTWAALRNLARTSPLPYRPLKTPRRLPLSKQPDFASVAYLTSTMGPLPKAFLDEVNYLQRFVAKQQEEDDQELAKALNYKEYETNQALMTCGCCYADCAFEDMVQCSEGHLFCRDCARRAMEDVLGRQLTQLKCINSEEPCSAVVAESTLRTFLSAKSLQLYDRLVQEEQIKKAIIGMPSIFTS